MNCRANYSRNYGYNGYNNYFWLGIFFIIALFFLAVPFGGFFGGFPAAGLLL